MKLFFITNSLSDLANPDAKILKSVKNSLLLSTGVEEVFSPDYANAIIIQEKNSFKNFRYISELLEDPLVSKYPDKIFTINTDDCATGLLKGIYTCLPGSRFNAEVYRSVPYMEFPNEFVFANYSHYPEPIYLASWRGNTKSNKIRSKMIQLFQDNDRLCLESTDSWLNHNSHEKEDYVNLIRKSRFSLCPAGWAPASFRIYESMALGKCPVIIADQFVSPKGPNWKEFALFFPEKKIHKLSAFLLEHEHQADDLGKKALAAWEKHFSVEHISQYYADSLISLICSTPKVSKKKELEKWTSLKLQWSNKWTLPQRALNKIKKIKNSF